MEAETEFADLPVEILLHIFHKLPHIVVVRCNLVCRKWRSLISDPFFTSTYNPRSIPNHPTSFMMIPREGSLSTSMYEIDMGSSKYYRMGGEHHRFWYEFSDNCDSCGVMVLGSWNGLIALYNRNREFLLVNPWTREEKWVRVGNDDDFGSSFDLYGLCHDPARDEYKAVLSKCRSARFYVVSFKDGKCKSKTQPNVLQGLNRHGYGFMSAVVKGVPHWIHEKGRPHWRMRGFGRERTYTSDPIIFFDQRMEEFGEVRLPKDDAKLIGLGALDGQLTVAVRGQLVGELEVWALKEENSWTKLFAIVMNFSVSTTISLSSWTADDKVLINRDHESYLAVYSCRDRNLREVKWLNSRQQSRLRGGPALFHCIGSPHRILTFVPSLVSPNRCGRVPSLV